MLFGQEPLVALTVIMVVPFNKYPMMDISLQGLQRLSEMIVMMSG